MPVAGPIFALDLGVRTGFAVGVPGAQPRSGAVILKKDREPRRVALSNLIAWLQDEWTTERPQMVATARPLHLAAFARLGNAEATVRMTYGLQAVVEAMAARFGVRHEEEYEATIRKHFLGVASLGKRSATKQAVVTRCHLLGLMSRADSDDDRADALAVHDWAAATFGRRAPSRLRLFGEQPA